ncbi:RsmB/NOP family class I SAM-dependent RNA methyltransferase [Tsukamurella paurometabola]|uniref:rRNA small subunit methyltransferase B n=1 Tax=Tsukamurella paurometabola TaxID=2061 RepID=A0ABS5N6X1_TSUPA|nr:rRNA small subunit methyltransferase B [Tsukamurella paurometabola]
MGPRSTRRIGHDPRSRPVTDPARSAALETLAAVRERGAYANLVLPGLLREKRLKGRDAAFATELTYGACRAQGLLDAVIESASGRSTSDIDGPVLDALRLGVYQLLRTRVGAHAAVSETVDTVKASSGRGASGFANAVLRKVSKDDEDTWVTRVAPSAADDLLGHLAMQYAHPRWIAEAFWESLRANGINSMGQLQALLASDDSRPPVHLVARPGEISAEELALIVEGETGRLSPYAVYLPGGDPGALEPVRDGLAGVQDEGSQLVARAAAVAPLEGPDGGRWLDLCAGPGGKAALLGSLAAIDGARVDAVEPAEHRAELVRKAVTGLPVDVHVADGRSSGLEPGYDRVLVDAPCSGIGALRRRPEARWRKQPSDVAELTVLQRELLTAAAALTRPGGVVLYATCSPHVAETLGIVGDDELLAVAGLERIDTRPLVPETGLALGDGPHVQLWPHLHGTDGMFFQALRKG